jgi:hypothetical protein
MALGALWSKVTGGIVALGVGAAARDAIDPVLEAEKQQAWARRAVKVLDPATAAEAAAENMATPVNLRDDAKRHGIGQARWEVLRRLADVAPDFPTLLRLRRRQFINPGNFAHGLDKLRLEDQWKDPLTRLLQEPLTPADVANAVQQGFIPGDGLLPPDPGPFEPITPPIEQVAIDPDDEAGAAGVNRERLRVLAQLAGLPPGAETLLELWRRGVISEEAVEAGIREGHTKTKWTSAIKALRWHLLSPATIVNLFLRGWIDRAEYHRRMRVQGYRDGLADDWYNSAGRPMAPVQAFNAWARGAPHVREPGQPARPGSFDFQDFSQAIRRSDIRPEYVDALWALRWAYPSLFQLRRAVQEGSISRARALRILHIERYEEQDAVALVNSWAAPTAVSARGLTAADLAAEYEGLYIDRATYVSELESLGYRAAQANEKANVADARRVRTARNATIARIRLSYVNHKIDRAEAVSLLDREAIPGPAHDLLLTEWDVAREATVAVLTPAQIKRAVRRSIWTYERGFAELVDRGYSDEDADVFLRE